MTSTPQETTHAADCCDSGGRCTYACEYHADLAARRETAGLHWTKIEKARQALLLKVETLERTVRNLTRDNERLRREVAATRSVHVATSDPSDAKDGRTRQVEQSNGDDHAR